jgi:hypothetical protein
MIARKDWLRINKILRERNIDPSQIKHINCIRMHPTESEKHFLAKAKRAFCFYKSKTPFLTEVWTKDHKKRYDLLHLIDDIDYEFETGKSKKKKYKADKEVTI